MGGDSASTSSIPSSTQPASLQRLRAALAYRPRLALILRSVNQLPEAARRILETTLHQALLGQAAQPAEQQTGAQSPGATLRPQLLALETPQVQQAQAGAASPLQIFKFVKTTIVHSA